MRGVIDQLKHLTQSLHFNIPGVSDIFQFGIAEIYGAIKPSFKLTSNFIDRFIFENKFIVFPGCIKPGVNFACCRIEPPICCLTAVEKWI